VTKVGLKDPLSLDKRLGHTQPIKNRQGYPYQQKNPAWETNKLVTDRVMRKTAPQN